MLRALWPLVNNRYFVECVLDGGSQIIAISERVWKQLGVPKNPEITISMQSANGTEERTLGLVTNLPFDFDDLRVYLHAHVVRDAPYDILLGRPFDILLQTQLDNRGNEDQYITLKDPNGSKTHTYATEPKGRPCTYMIKKKGDIRVIDDGSMRDPSGFDPQREIDRSQVEENDYYAYYPGSDF
jgi:hypothetical protein